MGNKSLSQSIKLLPHASCMRITNNHKENNQYWNYDSLALEKYSDSPNKYKHLIDKGGNLLRDAVESYAIEKENIIIPLSGGLDSRTIACFLSGKAKCQAVHIDYGFEKKYAKKIAQTLNIDFDVYPLKDWHPWDAIDSNILCSSHSIHQFWIFPFLKEIITKTSGTLLVDGYLMNEVIGGLSTIKQNYYSDLNSIYPPLNPDFQFILGDKIRKNYYTDHDSQISEIMANCPSDVDYDRYLYFSILNYGRRYTLLFSVVHQYLCSVGLPILDYNLMDFCLRIPLNLKKTSRFYRDIIVSSFPQISSIPWSRNRLPLDSKNKQHIKCNIINNINKYKYYLTRITHSKIETLPRHDKNRRFRKDKKYRDFYMNVIFDDQTFDKGYVSRSGVERIVYLIDTGRNYFGLLEKIALIEFISRELELTY